MDCGEHMTTLGRRSQSSRSCVNLPGYSYALYVYAVQGFSIPYSVPCPVGTYSAGMKKQRACVPCPTGFSTTGPLASSPTACVIPPGSYLKNPGMAALCPRGEYKSGWSNPGHCTKCAYGVTTITEGSTSESHCTVLQPGLYARNMSGVIITAAALCPQGFYCQGGKPVQVFNTSNPSALSTAETTIVACPNQLWTQELGSTSIEQCLTPPGHYTAAGKTLKCPAGSFRPDWKPATEANACTQCGVSVLALTSDTVTQYDIRTNNPTQVPISTSSEECFILPGQGLYYATLTKSWRAVDCNESRFGVSNITYGLTPAACRDCPSGTLTSTQIPASAKYLAATGYTSVLACVTKPGYGFSGRGAQLCDKGTYNPGGNLDACKECRFGTTTTGVGVGKTAADCVVAAGFGFVDGALAACPIGTYSTAINVDATTPCQLCPNGTTTSAAGSDSNSDCNLCAAGYGGTGCATLCGGFGEDATYGPPGRALSSQCLQCSSQGKTIGFSFDWNMQNDLFVPRTISRIGASSSVDCLSEYTQLVDGAWYLPLSSSFGVSTTPNVASFSACVDLCSTSGCQLVTYDYREQTCTQRMSIAPEYEGSPWIAFKTVLSGYQGTSPWSVGQTGNVTAKAVASGSYVYYQEPHALDVGIQSPAPGAASFLSVRDCANACDEAADCTAFTVQMTVAQAAVGTTCQLVRGNSNLGKFKRTVVRTELTRIPMPVYLCPSGYTMIPGFTSCVPITTAQAAVFVLTAQGTCDAATIQSVKDAITNYLSSPYSAFGVYVPKLQVEVNCLSSLNAQAFAGGRRLLQNEDSTRIAMTIAATYSGTGVGSEAVYADVEAAQCNIPQLCSRLNETSLKRGWLGAGTVKGGELELSMEGNETSAVIQAVYKENGTVVDMPTFITGPKDFNGLSCTYSRSGLARLFTCATSTAVRRLPFTAVSPNPVKPQEPLTATLNTPYLTCLDRTISTIAGGAAECTGNYGREGVLAVETCLSLPATIALDPAENVLLADYDACKIFKVDRLSGIMTRVAGLGPKPEPVRRRLTSQQPLRTEPHAVPAGGVHTVRGRQQTPPTFGALSIAARHYTKEATHSPSPRVRATAAQDKEFLGENVPALQAYISPIKMAVDAAGNILFTDWENAVRKIDAQTGIITTYAGLLGSQKGPGCVSSGDGGAASSAMLCSPAAVAIKPTTGDLFVAENDHCLIRRVDAITQNITTWFSSTPCVASNEGASPRFGMVYGMVFDNDGNLLVLDGGGDGAALMKINAATRAASIVAGGKAPPSDLSANGDGGPATAAPLISPSDVIVDRGYGHIYISQSPGSVRKINVKTGIISTVAGKPQSYDLGDGGPPLDAGLMYPTALAMGGDGALYIGDDVRVRKVTC